jgi:AcrR family transcriptional regulator
VYFETIRLVKEVPMNDVARPAGRPRSAAIDAALWRAALLVVETEGYARLTMERVAAMTGVSKATIYRRFGSRSELAAEALLAAYPIAPQQGEERKGAVERHLQRVFAAVSGPVGPVLRGLMADAQLDASFREVFRERFIRVRREALAVAVRHEYGNRAGLELALDLAFGAMWYRLLVGHAPLDPSAATEIAEVLRNHLRRKQSV